uniref:Secreted protein n=1 Tax=Romanomermis culicivorax TaxID=13658 RepID=A0A915KPD0_ROMCU
MPSTAFPSAMLMTTSSAAGGWSSISATGLSFVVRGSVSVLAMVVATVGGHFGVVGQGPLVGGGIGFDVAWLDIINAQCSGH